MNAYRDFNNQTNTFSPISINDYLERISYDPNRNITGCTRNGTGSRLAMDMFTYRYYRNTNQLAHVGDAVNSGNTDDIDNQKQNNWL
jgi:hypothetical protein